MNADGLLMRCCRRSVVDSGGNEEFEFEFEFEFEVEVEFEYELLLEGELAHCIP